MWWCVRYRYCLLLLVQKIICTIRSNWTIARNLFTRLWMINKLKTVCLVRLPVDLLAILWTVVGSFASTNFDSYCIATNPASVWLVYSIQQHVLLRIISLYNENQDISHWLLFLKRWKIWFTLKSQKSRNFANFWSFSKNSLITWLVPCFERPITNVCLKSRSKF